MPSNLRSPFIFRSSDRFFAVYGCACQCDGFVKVTGIMEQDVGSSRYWYIRGHQAVGTAYEHIGSRYEFEANALESNTRSLEATLPLPATLPLSAPENAPNSELDASGDVIVHCTDWDEDQKTPTVHLEWWQFPNDDESP